MAEVSPWLARFIYTRDHIRRDGSVKKGAFLEKRPPHDTSVDAHEIFAEDIHWEAGVKINPMRPLVGAADIETGTVEALGFSVVASPSEQNLHHAEIRGWELGDDDEKMLRIDKATELADASRFVVFARGLR